jgi:hypothetical protein
MAHIFIYVSYGHLSIHIYIYKCMNINMHMYEKKTYKNIDIVAFL